MKMVKCPICNTLAAWEGNPSRPFCSPECKGKDLGNWATERYRVASEDDPSPTESERKNEE